MEIILNILGAVVILLILCAIGVGLLAICGKVFDKHYERGQQAQFEIDARRLRDAAMWFSEDRATAELLQDLSERSDVMSIRDKWRERRNRVQPTAFGAVIGSESKP